MIRIEPQFNKLEATELFGLLAKINDSKEMSAFLRDLMTLEELEEIISRFKVVKQLQEKVPYRKIAKETGVSTTTITRINYWLHYGTGGYSLALKKL